MAFGKHVMIILVLVVVSGLALGCSETSTTAPTPTQAAEAPILAPANVQVALTGTGISVVWTPNTQTHLRGYNVYRMNRQTGDTSLLTPGTTTAHSYVDNTAASHSVYTYRVTSVSARGAESRATSADISWIANNGEKQRETQE